MSVSRDEGFHVSRNTHGVVVVRLHMIHNTLLRGSVFSRLIGHIEN
jgi:hypothetical protein